MKIPELIYQAHLRTPPMLPRRQMIYVGRSQTQNILVSDMGTVSQGHDLILQSLVIAAFAGSAQTVERFRGYVSSVEGGPGDDAIFDLFYKFVSGSAQAAYEWQGELYVPSQTKITVETYFSASVNQNSHYVSLTGFLVPQIQLMK